jgi:hypothetical protein
MLVLYINIVQKPRTQKRFVKFEWLGTLFLKIHIIWDFPVSFVEVFPTVRGNVVP